MTAAIAESGLPKMALPAHLISDSWVGRELRGGVEADSYFSY